MNNAGVTGLTPPKRLWACAWATRNSAYAVNLTYDRHTPTYRHTDNIYHAKSRLNTPHWGVQSRFRVILGKWFPLQGKLAHSLNFCLFECMLIERKRRERLNNNYRAINFPRLYNSSQTTSPQPNTNFYHTQSIIMSTLYLYTYIIYYELFYSQRLLLKWYNYVFRLVHIKKNDRSRQEFIIYNSFIVGANVVRT